MKLDYLDVAKFEQELKAFKVGERMISERIYEVLLILCKCLEVELYSWWYHCDELKTGYRDEEILIHITPKYKSELFIKHCEFLTLFQKKFLTMENEDIVALLANEVEQGIINSQKEAEIKNQEKSKKEAKEAKRQQVLAKLSVEDREALE